MMGIGAKLRAVLGSGSKITRENPKPEAETQDPKTEGDDEKKEDPVSLFECPSCETVYIGIEMTRCSQCDVAFDDAQSARSPVAGMD